MSNQEEATPLPVDEIASLDEGGPLENMARAQRAFGELTQAYKVLEERRSAHDEHQEKTKQRRTEAQERHQARVQEFAESIRPELEAELADVMKEEATLVADVEGAEEAYFGVVASLLDRGFFNRAQLKKFKFPVPKTSPKSPAKARA